MDCRWPQDRSKHPAVKRPISSSAVLCWLVIDICEQKWLRRAEPRVKTTFVAGEKVYGTDIFTEFPPNILLCSFFWL